ncbi:MAG: methylated-DNA--[protein]-cysteine S-methyltransferase [Steroidobacteraceae bacterium]|jgi:methylated-DNA-[protein]-cysteine S-methyltransferase
MTYYSQTESPIGLLILKSDGGALTGIYMTGTYLNAPSRPPSDLDHWVLDPSCDPLCRTARQLDEYFSGERRDFDLPLRLDGTEFQKRAWHNLMEIPYGDTRSYGEQARRIGNANASRAVGLANGRNPIPIVVPCHRVIGANGSLTGFGGGIERKRWLLEHERFHAREPLSMSGRTTGLQRELELPVQARAI